MLLRDYWAIVRRGWWQILIFVAVAGGSSAAYLLVVPHEYDANASLAITVRGAQSSTDLQQGVSFANTAAPTIAGIIGSQAVLQPAAAKVDPSLGVSDAQKYITVTTQSGTALIFINAHTRSARLSTDLANAVASTATVVLPELEGTRAGSSLLQVTVIQNATIPTSAAGPGLRQFLLVGALLGLIVGLVFTVTIDLLRRPAATADFGEEGVRADVRPFFFSRRSRSSRVASETTNA